MKKYLESGKYIDWKHPEVLAKAKSLANGIEEQDHVQTAIIRYYELNQLNYCKVEPNMNLSDKIHALWDHLFWADSRLFDALKSNELTNDNAYREFAHIIGSEETWLSRLQKRTAHTSVWPDLKQTELEQQMGVIHNAYEGYLADLGEKDLETNISYTNSAGKQFSNSISDILLHVALHSQYHRGKINLILRESGQEPVPVDYIAFVRGVPAATREQNQHTPGSG